MSDSDAPRTSDPDAPRMSNSDAPRMSDAQAPRSSGSATGRPPHAPAPRLGHPRLHLRRTTSTNDRARELAAAGAPGGTLVTASEQTAGRGRQGRRWSAPAGSALLASLLLRWPAADRVPALLPLIAGVAVCDVVGDDARIKWPNDIVLARGAQLAKLAGILVEGRPQESWSVLGIGLNVAVPLERLPPDVRQTAATLGRSPADIEPTLQQILHALERRLAEPAEEILRAVRARDVLRGRLIGWDGGRGRADGIDGAGRLVVALDHSGRTALVAGEVHLEPLG
jgi:BirA family biotin operon repressor/biotin-[acetyl-CoA-carboxylase] ligase